jgi:uncharacterized protein YcbK (DUF882 family)
MAQGRRASAAVGASIAAGLLVAGLLCIGGLLAPGSLGSSAIAAEGGSAPGAAVTEAKPETRTLHMKHHWLRESLDVTYKIGDEYQPAAMAEISRFMRDWHCDKMAPIDPGLVDRLYDLQQSIGPGRTIRLISGYRSEGYNASLLAAGRIVDPNSQHMLGRAADIFVPGVPADRVRKAAEQQGRGGVGYYPFSGPRFVHIDSGPDRHWTETDPAVRRRLGLPNPSRKAFKLDCSLTIEQVVKTVTPGKVFAALPQGAAVDPDPKHWETSAGIAASMEHTAAIAMPSRVADRERLCQTGDGALAGLLLLTPSAVPTPPVASGDGASASQAR